MKATPGYPVFLTSILFLVFGSCTSQSEPPKPNIIFILADDLGAGDLHCTGHPYANSPNLDRLAESGIRFERAYMAAAWCAPSRYALMSGKFPAREFDRTRNLRPDEPSVTKLLQEAGYTTGHFGKWHMTSGEEEYSRSPADFGIDEHFLTSYKGKANTWTREERREEYWRAGLTDAYVDMCIDFISTSQSAEDPSPFYLNLWIYPTHSYIHPTPEQLEPYRDLEVNIFDFRPYQQEFLEFVSEHGDLNQAMQAYCADVTAMDLALGRLFDFLEKADLRENTLIVFTSDNGPGPLTTQVLDRSVTERYIDRPDLLNSVGSAGIYRERKLSLHDGGIRVPWIVSWPSTVPEGRIDSSSVIHGTDWLPTIASICGVELPEGIYDGTDVKDAFLGKTLERSKELYWTQSGNTALMSGDWKAVLTRQGEFKLYDIRKDPSELQNLAADYPEKAEAMEQSLDLLKKEYKP
jgi:N-acetylgalactosamine-6-sulfatase